MPFFMINNYDKDNKENESNSISPDESIRMENKEETESSREEGAVDADLLHCDSHLKIMERIMITMNKNYDDSHHNVNRTKFLSELQGSGVVLKREDPHVQRQRYHGGQT